MKIHKLNDDVTDDLYFDHNFKNMLEDHLTYLKLNNPRAIDVTEHQNYKWEGDFYGLLDDLTIPKDFHYIVLRMNGLTNSAHYKGELKMILLPDFQEVENLKTIFQTKNI